MPATSPAQPTYDVRLVQCPGLAPELRLAAESRFKAALEFALGGAEQVLLALQAYRLAQALAQDLDEDPDDESELGQEETNEDEDEDEDGDEDEADDESLIALWEKAESDAIAAAVKPLAAEAREQIATARFEIIPH